MPTDVLEVTKRFMRNPIRILVKREELTLEGIKQFFVSVNKEVSGAVSSSITPGTEWRFHFRSGSSRRYAIFTKR